MLAMTCGFHGNNGVAFSKKGKSREGSSRRLLGAAELAEQKALFDEAKQTILSARRLSQK